MYPFKLTNFIFDTRYEIHKLYKLIRIPNFVTDSNIQPHEKLDYGQHNLRYILYKIYSRNLYILYIYTHSLNTHSTFRKGCIEI